jgi:hypothetical protein
MRPKISREYKIYFNNTKGSEVKTNIGNPSVCATDRILKCESVARYQEKPS